MRDGMAQPGAAISVVLGSEDYALRSAPSCRLTSPVIGLRRSAYVLHFLVAGGSSKLRCTSHVNGDAMPKWVLLS
jgi:hypothetical protein